MRAIETIVAVVTLSLLLGAGPTTQPGPTTKPAAAAAAPKRPIPKNWTTAKNQTYHFTFRLPPQWKAMQASDTFVAYQIPQNANAMMPPALFTVTVGPCHESTTEADAAELRKSLAQEHPKAKITKDQAATLGERAAWAIAMDDVISTKMTRQFGNRPPVTTEIKHPWKVLQLSYVEGKLHYYVSFQASAAQYTDNAAALQQVLDSFAWTPSAASSGK